MSPGDAAIAVRTFPRRWREAFALVDEDQSVPAEAIALAEEAVLALAGAAARLGAPVGGGPSEDVLDRMAVVAPVLAERIEMVEAETWRAQRSLLTGVTGAVEEVAAALRAAERMIAQGDS